MLPISQHAGPAQWDPSAKEPVAPFVGHVPEANISHLLGSPAAFGVHPEHSETKLKEALRMYAASAGVAISRVPPGTNIAFLARPDDSGMRRGKSLASRVPSGLPTASMRFPDDNALHVLLEASLEEGLRKIVSLASLALSRGEVDRLCAICALLGHTLRSTVRIGATCVHLIRFLMKKAR